MLARGLYAMAKLIRIGLKYAHNFALAFVRFSFLLFAFTLIILLRIQFFLFGLGIELCVGRQ